jgi:Fe-S cluster biogenesis protein NfuA
MLAQTKLTLIQKIEIALADIRPYLESDGGDISLVKLPQKW